MASRPSTGHAARQTPACQYRRLRSLDPNAIQPLTPRELVDRLDARHDELIAKLDELNAEIEAALAEFGRPREAERTEIKKAA